MKPDETCQAFKERRYALSESVIGFDRRKTYYACHLCHMNSDILEALWERQDSSLSVPRYTKYHYDGTKVYTNCQTCIANLISCFDEQCVSFLEKFFRLDAEELERRLTSGA